MERRVYFVLLFKRRRNSIVFIVFVVVFLAFRLAVVPGVKVHIVVLIAVIVRSFPFLPSAPPSAPSPPPAPPPPPPRSWTARALQSILLFLQEGGFRYFEVLADVVKVLQSTESRIIKENKDRKSVRMDILLH